MISNYFQEYTGIKILLIQSIIIMFSAAMEFALHPAFWGLMTPDLN